MADESSPMYMPDAGGTGLTVSGEYDPGISAEVDRKIRNMPGVIEHITKKANELLASTGSGNFDVLVSAKPGQSRPRAYVRPINSAGIHEELSQAVLLKAAMGMAGK